MKMIQQRAASARAAVALTEVRAWGAAMWIIRSGWHAPRFICGRNRAFPERKAPERSFFQAAAWAAVSVRTGRFQEEMQGL